MGANQTKTNHHSNMVMRGMPPPHQVHQLENDHLQHPSQRYHHLVLHNSKQQILTTVPQTHPSLQQIYNYQPSQHQNNPNQRQHNHGYSQHNFQINNHAPSILRPVDQENPDHSTYVIANRGLTGVTSGNMMLLSSRNDQDNCDTGGPAELGGQSLMSSDHRINRVSSSQSNEDQDSNMIDLIMNETNIEAIRQKNQQHLTERSSKTKSSINKSRKSSIEPKNSIVSRMHQADHEINSNVSSMFHQSQTKHLNNNNRLQQPEKASHQQLYRANRQQSSDCENDSPNSENDYDFGSSSNNDSLHVALYDFKSGGDNQLSLYNGEIIHVTTTNKTGEWCEAVSKCGHIGWVPSNYITPVSLDKHPWYHGQISRDTAEYLLSSGIDGSFLVRDSFTHQGSRSVSLRFEGRVYHYRINEENGRYFITSDFAFTTLAKLIHHHSMHANGLTTTLLYPAPKQVDPNAILNNPSTTNMDAWEINPVEIVINQQIGLGQWGVVNEAIWLKHNIRVAVKTLKSEMKHLEDEFLEEAELMKRMRHPNLVQLLGICRSDGHIYIMTEFMTKGNLLDYLRDCDHDQINGFVLMYMATQICSAMSYLESRDMVHRDLAARNCLVSDNHLVKVADFGLTRTVKPDEVYTAHVGAKFPIKWTAPEGLAYNKFTTKSDVWSFGVLLWEIATYGMTPYPGVELSEVFYTLNSGHRMGRPTGCPEPIHQLMQQCWAWEPSDRPAFWELHERLQSLLLDPNIFDLIEHQEAMDKEHLEREQEMMKMNNMLDFEQQQQHDSILTSSNNDNSSPSPNGYSANASTSTAKSRNLHSRQTSSSASRRLSMTQFDPEWAIEEFHRQKQQQQQQQQQQQKSNDSGTVLPSPPNIPSVSSNRFLLADKPKRSTNASSGPLGPGLGPGKKVAPKPPKRTSSYRDPSYQDQSSPQERDGIAHKESTAQYESGVSLSNAEDGSASTMDGLDRMFQSLSHVKISLGELSPALSRHLAQQRSSDSDDSHGLSKHLLDDTSSARPNEFASQIKKPNFFRQKSFESEMGRIKHNQLGQVTRSRSKILNNRHAS